MRLSERKQQRKGPLITSHMKTFGDRYNPRTKILTTEKGERLEKYAHGYFPVHLLNKKMVTPKVKKFLETYPNWIMLQKEIETEEFQLCFKIMIEAHPKFLSIFENENENKINLLREIDHIRFPYLKELEIHFEEDTNLEPLGWIEAPSLESIIISSNGVFTSIHPLSKTNFPNLKILKLEITNRKIAGERNYDLTKCSRMRMINSYRKEKGFTYFGNGSINFFRRDVSDIGFLAKAEIEKLQDFRIPQLNKYLYGKSLNMRKMIEALNRKYQNATSYYDLVSNEFGNFADDIYGVSDSDSDIDLDSDDDDGYYYNDSDSDREPWGYGYWRSPYDFDDDFNDYYDD